MAAAQPGDTSPRRGPGRPAGRRSGAPDTRRQILDAARAEFARSGYAGTSVRGIARSAGVDPALVHHYFGPKERVFIAALDLPLDPDVLVPHILADGPDRMGERLARFFFTLWEDPELQPRMLALLRTTLAGDEWDGAEPTAGGESGEAASGTGDGRPPGADGRPVGGLIRDFLTTALFARVARELDADAPEAALRAGLAASQMMGLAFGRYVLGLEPLASTPPETLVAAVGPTLQRYLRGEVA
ncbi:TetR/AcrR family transcriptional regulator [Yinghuangia seranimata]|uniref:TetR/AcrR family transcriptional regulator n=1 Tax=Yinghuangia seranimata TaxID=408067 RepID=UPI00248AD752|nr:TetR family transcriptional regulator [Yinghuangia seranimata]MDI2132922.1 TetR family transcriptional regulator [Yinghuangia seranimata]